MTDFSPADPAVDPAGLADLVAAGIDVAGVGRLRRPAPADAAAYVLAGNEEEIRRWTEMPAPYDHSHAIEFITARVEVGLADGSMVAFTIAAPDDSVLGVVSLHDLDPDGSASVGFWVAPWARRRNVGAAAVVALTDWAFGDVGLRRITWRAVVGNVASLHLARRAGFQPEGTLRSGLRHRERMVDAWIAACQPGDPRPAGLPADARVEIAAGAWQLQPISAVDASLAEAALPVSACLPDVVWAVKHATTAEVTAFVALLTSSVPGRPAGGWVLAAPAGGVHPTAAQGAIDAGRAAVERYSRLALGLQLP